MAHLPRIQPQLVLSKKIPDVGDLSVYRKVLPTFAVLYPNRVMDLLDSIDSLHYDAKLLLHGEQYGEIYRPLPTRGQIRSSISVSGLHDKRKVAIVEVEVLSRDAKTDNMLCLNRYTMFLRGAGGFSPSSKPFSYSKRTTHLRRTTPAPNPLGLGQPEEAADIVYDDQTCPSQALIYRLSGDYNPIHSDPLVAAKAGFKLPVLHGLCTMGFAVRAIIRSCCNGDPTRVQSFQGRFLSHVFPGEKLTTEMWFGSCTIQGIIQDEGRWQTCVSRNSIIRTTSISIMS